MTITHQCELLGVCRSSLYYRPGPVSAVDLALMRRLDELHLNYPFLGARRLADMLQLPLACFRLQVSSVPEMCSV